MSTVSLTAMNTLWGKGTSLSAYVGLIRHPAGTLSPSSLPVSMSTFLNQYPSIQPGAGVVSTYAGTYGNGGDSSTSLPGNLYDPRSIVRDNTSGNLYIGELGAGSLGCVVRKITPAGVMSVFAGTVGSSGYSDTAPVKFGSILYVLAVDASGNVYVGDHSNYVIRKITSAGVVSTLAGTVGVQGFANGTGTAASFKGFINNGGAVDSSGNLYVSDPNNLCIRKITPGAVVSTFLTISYAFPLCIDSSNNLYTYVASDFTIKKITPGLTVTTIAGVSGTYGTGTVFSDGPALSVAFQGCFGLALDKYGNLYFADLYRVIRRVSTAAYMTVVAGGVDGHLDGTGTSAKLTSVYGMAIDDIGNLYVCEAAGSHTVRKIT